ncbi:hypothetical protein YERSI8AC_130088 [Enterobacterales bacterium 8AC]|nr:hypothetical protein YERSI8AC_130088 [Enterobacterales bacterium 8AC]
MIRQAIKKRKVFSTDDSVRKVIYLAIQAASKKWSMLIQNWQLHRITDGFPDRHCSSTIGRPCRVGPATMVS